MGLISRVSSRTYRYKDKTNSNMNHLDKLDDISCELIAKHLVKNSVWLADRLGVMPKYRKLWDLKQLDKARPLNKHFMVRQTIKHGNLEDILEIYKNDSIDSKKFAELVDRAIRTDNYNPDTPETHYPEFIRRKLARQKEKRRQEQREHYENMMEHNIEIAEMMDDGYGDAMRAAYAADRRNNYQ